MVAFTFWNVDNTDKPRDIAMPLVRLAIETRCDVLITAETGDAHVGLESYLQAACDVNFRHLTLLPCRVHVWTKLPSTRLRRVESVASLYEAFELLSASLDPVLLVFAHLRSKPRRHSTREWADTLEFVAALRKMEQRRSVGGGTVVLGDLNLHPYDVAMRYPDSLNAVASRQVVTARPRRTHRKATYERFYNPTWNLLGDANGPPGTHYWRNGREEAGWYVLDHVLLRPAIVPRFRTSSLRVVTTIGRETLVGSDGTLARRWPDHLPLTFELE